ncbi:hypothetical protein [Adhaeribacter aquaticus]|uniref:hypothetical protein n=1 Tax=Adhaeribacter aquaticus TaxID=299567 RepID=UPI0003F543BD|nr:hypothetical protein [Adhaeribacter aquaticus]
MLESVSKDSANFDQALTYLKNSIVRLDEILKDINSILSIRDKIHVLEKESIKLVDVIEQTIYDFKATLDYCQGEVSLHIEEELQV